MYQNEKLQQKYHICKKKLNFFLGIRIPPSLPPNNNNKTRGGGTGEAGEAAASPDSRG